MPPIPQTMTEAARWVVVALGVGILAVIGYYAVNALLAVSIAAALLLVAGFFFWIVGGRIWDWARHGKPLFRRDWGSDPKKTKKGGSE